MNLLEVEVLCPLYNSKNKVKYLIDSLKKQKNIKISKIRFVITDTNDGVEELLTDNNIEWYKIQKSEFNHGLTRESLLFGCKTKYAIMCTDDVLFANEYSLYNLVNSMIKNHCKFAFGKQICQNNTMEKYTKKFNYPNESYIVEKKDVDSMQIKAFFASDSFACYDVDIFKSINGYDKKILPTNEDMYYAKKILFNNYKMIYVSNAIIYHSHNFTLKQIYERYFLVGKFFKENPEFKKYKSTNSGFKLALYVFGNIIKSFDIKNLFKFIPDMLCRYFGKRKGEK